MRSITITLKKNNLDSEDSVKQAYVEWLAKLVSVTRTMPKWDLVEFLSAQEYYAKIEGDSEIPDKCKFLRSIFADQFLKGDLTWLNNDTCSMLEFLVQMSYEMASMNLPIRKGFRNGTLNSFEVKRRVYFWDLILNLELIEFTLDDEDYPIKKLLNERIINSFLEREYGPKGNGGIFPLSETRKNQTRNPILKQLSEYMKENFT